MGDVLKSFSDPNFMNRRGSRDLGRRLHMIASTALPELSARHRRMELGSYAEGENRAIAQVKAAQARYREANPHHFAVINDLGDVVGAATLYRDFPVSSVRVPMPPYYARRDFLRKSYPDAGTKLSAWTGRVHGYVLHRAYRELPAHCGDGELVHALELVGSPSHVHEAICEAGFVPEEKARFDDGEARRQIPPVSILYTGKVIVSDIAQIVPR